MLHLRGLWSASTKIVDDDMNHDTVDLRHRMDDIGFIWAGSRLGRLIVTISRMHWSRFLVNSNLWP